MNRKPGNRQSGTTTVEFAIIGVLVMVVLLGVIEVSRFLLTTNMLAEVTRRGARVAAICPVNDGNIVRAAMFRAAGGGASSPVYGLSDSEISVEYLTDNGTALTGTLTDPAVFVQIAYVRVSVQNYQHRLALFGNVPITLPTRWTTLPRESLGIPRDGTTATCT